MAKPLGAKSILIREAINANPKKGNKEIAELLNDAPERKNDKIKVSANDVAQQKQAMKKSKPAEAKPAAATKTGGNGRKKRGRRRGQRKAEVPAAAPAKSTKGDVFEHMAAIKRAVEQLGAAQVKRVVELFE